MKGLISQDPREESVSLRMESTRMLAGNSKCKSFFLTAMRPPASHLKVTESQFLTASGGKDDAS